MQEYIYNVKCVLSYDGSMYQGFQVQHDDPTIELELMKALKVITKEPTKIFGSGRTDKGVHAFGQVFNFHTNLKVPANKLMYAINRMLPQDIRVTSVEYVDMDFHARFSAVKKEYRYYIKYQNYSPLHSRYSHYKEKLDLDKMQEAIKLFEGTHNFEGFCSSEVDKRKDCTKTIYNASINKRGDFYEFVFEGTGFLKYQIRRMMSLLIAIGEGKDTKERILELYQTKEKQMYHRIAPGCGLYLYRVDY